MYIVVAVKVQQATGHLAGHALQRQGVRCQCLGRTAAPQVALQVTLSGWQQQRYPWQPLPLDLSCEVSMDGLEKNKREKASLQRSQWG